MISMSYDGSFDFDGGQQHGAKVPLAAKQLITSLLPGGGMGAATAFRLADLLIMFGDVGAGVSLIETGQQLLDAAQRTTPRMHAAVSGEDDVEYGVVNRTNCYGGA
jgi:hypothetical protein